MTKHEVAAWFCRVTGAAFGLNALFYSAMGLTSIISFGIRGALGTGLFSLLPLLLWSCLFIFADIVAAQMTGEGWSHNRQPLTDRRDWFALGLSCAGVLILLSGMSQLPMIVQSLWMVYQGGSSSYLNMMGGTMGLIMRAGIPLFQAILGFYLAFARHWFATARHSLETPRVEREDD